jgi:hypothetical protein
MCKNRWNVGTGYRYNEKPLGTQGVKVNSIPRKWNASDYKAGFKTNAKLG